MLLAQICIRAENIIPKISKACAWWWLKLGDAADDLWKAKLYKGPNRAAAGKFDETLIISGTELK